MTMPEAQTRRLPENLRRCNAGLHFRLAGKLAGLTVAVMAFALPGRATDTSRTTFSILIVESGDNRPTFLDFMPRVHQTLTSNLSSHVVIYRENLDLSHFSGTSYRTDLESWLCAKYRGRKLDAVVASGPASVDFILKVRPKLWPRVPVIAVGTKEMETAWLTGQTNVSAILVDTDVDATLQAALRVCPNTRHIAFVSSTEANLPGAYGPDFEKAKAFSANRFEFIALAGLTMEETKRRLAALPPDTIVFYDDIWKDAAGKIFVPRDALDELSSVSTAPIFSYSDSYIGYGMTGGSCIANRTLATEAANHIAAVLRADNASSVPALQNASYRTIFDWRQLRRYGLDEKNIPPGSEIRSRPTTLWESYHRTMIAAAAILLVQSLSIAALLLQRRRKRQVETELFNSRLMLRMVLDTIPQRVFWKDLHSVFLGCNKSMAEDCGFAGPAELIGKTDEATTGAAWAERYRADDREVIESNRPKLNYEKPQRRPDGSQRWLRLNKLPFHDRDGRIIGVLGTYEDITELKQANEALHESQALYHSFVEQMPAGVFRKNAEGRYVYVNRWFCKYNDEPGVKPADFLGKTPEEMCQVYLLHSRSNPQQHIKFTTQGMEDHRLIMRTGRRIDAEEKHVAGDGTERYLRVVKTPVFGPEGRIIGSQGVMFDITEIKRAEEMLRDSDRRFRSLMDNAPDAVYVQTNQRVVYANHATLRLLRAEHPEQLLGQPVLDFVAPEWREMVRQRMQKVNADGGPLPALEEEYLCVDKTRVTVEVTAVPTVFQGEPGALVFVRDITERKRSMETIAYERQLLRTLLDLMPYGVYLKDLDSRFLMANETLARRLGRENPAELLGLSDRDFFPPEVAAVFRADEEKVFAGETINDKEEIVVFPNSQERTLWTTKVPFRNSQGQICGLVGIGRDVTEQKLLEEQFRQSQKMEAFGQLAGGVAHDFNNLLTVIEGHVALLQLKEDSTPAEQAGSLAEIAKAAERAANLTRQLLTFSRRQLFQPKPVDLNDIVANTTKMLQRLIGEHIGLETHFTPGGAPITADRNMMEQILINLAVNSRDAMPKGGKLIIQTATVTLDEADIAIHPKARPGTFIHLSVTDTGCGIGTEEIERIFEPFFTTKEVGKGTGLGLATVFGIVTQHHGWIEVESKLNVGTTFQVYLPRMTEQESVLARFSRPPEVPGGHETILLVEDEAPVRSLVRTLLERKGYRIIEADSGLSALEIWQHQRNTIDLLFTDMVMPDGLSGRELAAQLRAEKPGLKVMYASGYTDDMLGNDSPLRDNPNFVEKPFESHQLLKRVRDCLDGPAGN